MTQNEINELREIVKRYSEIDNELNSIQEKMKEFKVRHDTLSEELSKLAEREKSFIDEIKKNYGKVDLNEFLKYIIDDKNESN
jgi:archaellum component FlaC